MEAMEQGAIAGYPIKGVRVRLFDGSYHTVDSSEMAFKMAGSIAMKQALEQASPVLLEPIMLVTASVPDESVGDVMGDLSSRRGRPLGTEAVGGMTEVKAEVPMAEMLSYAPDLRSITGGQGEYALEFLRYEEVPAHLAQKVIDKARRGGGGRSTSARNSTPHANPPGGPLLDSPGASWRRPRTSRPTRRTWPATSAGARCCAASTPRATSRRASAARSASCAPRAPSTRAGSASPAATTSRCAIRAARAAGARSSTACARAASAPARSTTRSRPTRGRARARRAVAPPRPRARA